MTDTPTTPNFDPMSPDHARDAFLEDIAEEVERTKELSEAFERAPEVIEDDATEARMTDFAKQLGACGSAIEKARKDHKGRYDACGTAIHGVAKKHTDNLAGLKRQTEARLTAYQRKKADEERRRREEEAERARREAEEKAAIMQTEEDLAAAASADEAARKAAKDAGAKPAEMHRARGEYGGVASLRSVLAFEIGDSSKIRLESLRPFLPPEVIEKAVRGYMKANVELVKRMIANDLGHEVLEGVRFFEDSRTVVR